MQSAFRHDHPIHHATEAALDNCVAWLANEAHTLLALQDADGFLEDAQQLRCESRAQACWRIPREQDLREMQN